MGSGYSLSNPRRRAVLERRIQDRRLGTALSGYTVQVPDGIAWGRGIEDELARLPPEAAARLLHQEWAPAGWAVSFIFEPGSVLVWQARHKPTMRPGDYLTAICPLDLHEQMGLYPARRVTVEL